jgi:5-methyltetrahydropteroyltriglutamate--homocysteine methyltransferase
MTGSAPHDPPFRAEHIGSLLRPPSLLAARREHRAGSLGAEELRAAEDAAIADVARLQAELGLGSITDGEFRRESYSDSFTTAGFESVGVGDGGDGGWSYADSTGNQEEGRVAVVGGRLLWTRPVNVENFKYLASVAPAGLPKMTLPGPCYLHFRAGRDNISRAAYPDLDLFWQDIVDNYHKEMAALANAGCRYIQLDETSIAKLGDDAIRGVLKERGDDWEALLETYTDVINAVAAGRPDGVKLGMHLCRGNKRGHWQAEGGLDDVAMKLFQKLDLDFYYLEYDSPRAGTFAPLAAVPDHKTVVLGLVSTKQAELEDADAIKRRIDEAAAYVDLDRLALSPQCGFASHELGNPISFEQQAAKIRLVVDVAKDVWGYQPAPVAVTGAG